MPYTILEKKINTLPERGIEELSHYVDYLCYVYNQKKELSETESLKKIRESSLATVWDGLKNDTW